MSRHLAAVPGCRVTEALQVMHGWNGSADIISSRYNVAVIINQAFQVCRYDYQMYACTCGH